MLIRTWGDKNVGLGSDLLPDRGISRGTRVYRDFSCFGGYREDVVLRFFSDFPGDVSDRSLAAGVISEGGP